ncbi:MAG: glycosyltransferase [Acidobacteria bacterium]|nr:glycosyltransferase [Acidobacteriota bacterium]
MEQRLHRLHNPEIDAGDVYRYRIPGRLAYIINHSFPYASDGYAVRTHGIASALVRKGYSVIAINAPGNPWDLHGFKETSLFSHQDIEGVRYLYTRNPGRKILGKDYPEAAAEALKQILRLFKPSYVMAASDWENALPSAIASKELGLPFFYEVRGFWEMSRLTLEPEWENSSQHQYTVKMETEVAKAADTVYTLNHFMREELVRRGIQMEKIAIMPNAYRDIPPDWVGNPRLHRTDLGCNTQYVVGYIGAFSEYEGLDDLVKACARVRGYGVDLSLVLVGSSPLAGLEGRSEDCPVSRQLRQLAVNLKFGDYLHLPGRKKPEELTDYYKLMDLVVIPRKPLPVCEFVPPIKPLEVAAHRKAMLLSDVKPLKEMAQEAKVEYCFKAGDVNDLSLKIKQLFADERKLEELAESYSRWVFTNRTWDKSISGFTEKCPVPARPVQDKRPRSTYRADDESTGAIECLPFENPTPNSKSRLRIASILDTFSHTCFDPICELIPITPENWQQQLSEQTIDLLLVESAWHGNNDSWLYRVAKYDAPPGNELPDVIKWSKKMGIPTVFWNKEDPPNFYRFIESACRFDYIFTTDENCIDRYRKYVPGNTYIAALPFAAQPVIHNPHMSEPRLPVTSFAGTYYADDFGSRRRSMDMLLRVAGRHGLDIFDRMYDVTGKEKERFKFPEDLQTYIRGKLDYEEMLKAYRRYRVGLNVNSVSDSPTMFSRRVFELLACGTPVVSTYSLGIDRIFNGLVDTVKTEEETVDAVQYLLTDPLYWLKRSVKGVRNVFEFHTYTHRLHQIAKATGLGENVPPYRDMVLVLFPDGDAKIFTEMLVKQRQLPVEIVVVGLKHRDNNVKYYMEHISAPSIKTAAIPRENVVDYLRTRHPQAGVAICSGKHYYGPSYLLDACISISGDPSVKASTMHPREDSHGYLNKLNFNDVDKLGMDTTRAYPGTLAVNTESKILDEIFRAGPDGYCDVSEPVMNRPWVEFLPGADTAERRDCLDI